MHAPFSLDLEEHDKHFTNFDSTGRYLVVLQKFNVVREHEQPIQVKDKQRDLALYITDWFAFLDHL